MDHKVIYHVLVRNASNHLPTWTTKFWTMFFKLLTSNHHPTWNTIIQPSFQGVYSDNLPTWNTKYKTLFIMRLTTYYLPTWNTKYKYIYAKKARSFFLPSPPRWQQSYFSKLLLLTTSPHGPLSIESYLFKQVYFYHFLTQTIRF